MATSQAALRHYSPPAPAYELFKNIPKERRAEPFVKWSGGKKRHLAKYDPLLPAHFEAYHEPFLGGGAVFFYLAHIGRIQKSILSDLNSELIHTYRTIRDDVEYLIEQLLTYKYDKDAYYETRALDAKSLHPIERAARMLYLNRTCFNGLYRVNSKGQFNVPFGRYKNPVICDAANLRNVSRLLQGVELQCWSFETVAELASPGDFVYLDPPYQPVAAARFTEYTPDAFTQFHQGKLREIFRLLDRRGCLVMLSSAKSPVIQSLFKGYDIKEIQTPRAVQRNGRGRGKRHELIIRNYA